MLVSGFSPTHLQVIQVDLSCSLHFVGKCLVFTIQKKKVTSRIVRSMYLYMFLSLSIQTSPEKVCGRPKNTSKTPKYMFLPEAMTSFVS